jgi:hypothetical protein
MNSIEYFDFLKPNNFQLLAYQAGLGKKKINVVSHRRLEKFSSD